MRLHSSVPTEFRSQAKMAAGFMMVIGALAVLLPFYFTVFAVLIVGSAVLLSGLLGLIYNWQLTKLGVDFQANRVPWLFVVLGLFLLFTPRLTLSIAGLLVGSGLVFSGVTGWLAEKRAGEIFTWSQLRHGITGTFGIILVLSGGSGIAWLIGVFFGLNMLMAGANLWRSVTAEGEMF